ncbi:MAG: hypothetical protein ACREPZ_11285 [Rhodanobacteraceae bacterium]
MNSNECAIVQRLIADLDNTRLLHVTLAPLLIRPHLKFLVERMAEVHATIADDLVSQMDPTGAAGPHRGARRMARVRARIERWIAITNLDIELGCLKCIARHETRVTQRLRHAMDNVRALHPNLHREVGQLERTLFRIDSLMREMEMPSLPAVMPRRSDVIPLPSPGRSRS